MKNTYTYDVIIEDNTTTSNASNSSNPIVRLFMIIVLAVSYTWGMVWALLKGVVSFIDWAIPNEGSHTTKSSADAGEQFINNLFEDLK